MILFQLEAHVKHWLKATLSKYDDTGKSPSANFTMSESTPRKPNAMKDAWDEVMKKYSCCGLDSDHTDFIASTWYRYVEFF